MKNSTAEDLKSIDSLTKTFFSLFTNKDGQAPNVDAINDLFIPEGIIINNTSGSPEIYSLQTFIAPRKELLTNGTLTEFSESETANKTALFGTIAQRFSHYQKSGKLNNVPFQSEGKKSIQFIKTNGHWKITSVAWSDLEI